MARSPRERVEAIIRAGFSTSNFRREVIAAWLNFYVLAQTSPEAKRLLSIYQNRLQANLTHDLRKLVGNRAAEVAERIAGMIDGLYLREVLGREQPSGKVAIAHVIELLNLETGACQ